MCPASLLRWKQGSREAAHALQASEATRRVASLGWRSKAHVCALLRWKQGSRQVLRIHKKKNVVLRLRWCCKAKEAQQSYPSLLSCPKGNRYALLFPCPLPYRQGHVNSKRGSMSCAKGNAYDSAQALCYKKFRVIFQNLRVKFYPIFYIIEILFLFCLKHYSAKLGSTSWTFWLQS